MTSNRSLKPPQSSTERGYGADHRAEREAWQQVIDEGEGRCTAAVCLVAQEAGSRFIPPGSDWHLGHLPDRSGWSGPEHVTCNTSEGGRRGNPRGAKPKRSRREPAWYPTESW